MGSNIPHIAVLFEFPTLNGGEHSMLAVLQRLQSRSQFQFSAIAPADGPLADRLKAAGIRLVPWDVRDQEGAKRGNSELQSELEDIVCALQPDILHANSLSMSRLVGGCAMLSCGRTGHLRDIMNLNRKPIADLNANDWLVAVSAATRHHHVGRGLDRSRCDVIYNGIDVDEFSATDVTYFQKLKSDFDLPKEGRILLNVGQICLRKGQLDLAKAVVRLLPRHPDLHLVLAGERHSGKSESVDYEAAIQQQFESHGLSGHLHRIGYCDQVPALMQAATLLVHSARQEPFGRVLLEAAACGLPIIATDVGGTSEMLRDQQEAILVSPGDESQLTEAIETALARPQQYEVRAAAARRRIHQLFSLQSAADRLADFWQKVAEERGT
ncbi:MAG: hypothetical protein Fues2KO_48780 [Fuerstiella sp.]